MSGCGLFSWEEREPWRAEAEQRCLAEKRVIPTFYLEPIPAIDGPRTCGLDRPFRVKALADGTIAVDPNARMGCPITAAMQDWLRDVVQPAAVTRFGVPVVEVKNAASYGCRTRNNQRGARMSEHAYGNAIDVKGFVLADGREVTVKTGWRGSQEEQGFLREAVAGACNLFTTTLGPGAAYHSDHFHMDLARHDAKGERRYCNPRPDVPPSTIMVGPVPVDDVPMSYAANGKPLPQWPIARVPGQKPGAPGRVKIEDPPAYVIDE